MTLGLVKPGGWDAEDPLTSDEVNAFQAELAKAIDGVGGGTYELQAPLSLSGAPIEISDGELNLPLSSTLSVAGTMDLGPDGTFNAYGDIELSGQLNVTAGADVNVKTGGELNIQGTSQIDIENGAFLNVFGIQAVYSGAELRVTSGGKIRLIGANTLDVENGADLNVKLGGDLNVESGGDIHIQSGGKINVAGGGEVILGAPNQLKIDDQAFGGYHNMVPLSRVPGEWDPAPVSGLWLDNAANGTATIRFAITLQPGDSITGVVVNFEGQSGVTGHSGVPSIKPLFTLVEVDFDGSSLQIAQATDPSATQPDYDAPHLITLSGGLLPRLADGGKRLVLIVRCEGGTNAAAGKSQIIGIGFTGIARVIRNVTLHV